MEKTLYRDRDFLSDRSLRENTLILSFFYLVFIDIRSCRRHRHTVHGGIHAAVPDRPWRPVHRPSSWCGRRTGWQIPDGVSSSPAGSLPDHRSLPSTDSRGMRRKGITAPSYRRPGPDALWRRYDRCADTGWRHLFPACRRHTCSDEKTETEALLRCRSYR